MSEISNVIRYMESNQRKLRAHLSRRWRKVGYGRLYWKANNRRWLRDFFESDDVCVVVDGPARTHYKTLAAFLEDIEDLESDVTP